jgi:hypothetical protein
MSRKRVKYICSFTILSLTQEFPLPSSRNPPKSPFTKGGLFVVGVLLQREIFCRGGVYPRPPNISYVLSVVLYSLAVGNAHPTFSPR